MAKRDQSFQAVTEHKTKLENQLVDSQNTIRVLKIERDEAIKNLKEKELGNNF